ncbi:MULTISPECIES: hypothetical protein [Methylomonas]|uniref:hypothetical protein n=1 Tax=Methylomonas TaxID=416 RepID=UPI000A8C3567|nr:hypothetical protein [Methylomonas koyamae]
MKTAFFRPLNLGLALALSLCRLNSAHASASYDSIVTLSYSIGILDSTNPTAGDRTGLSILGTYQQASDDQNFYAVVGGDGQYQSYSPNPAAATVSGKFTGLYSVGGNVNSGSVDSLLTGLFGLELNNNGPYSYNVAVDFQYALQAAAHGEFASTNILFDYWDEGGSNSGFDYVSAEAFSGDPDDQQSAADTATFHFGLAAGATRQLYAQAGISSHLESADASPVPLPGAVWPFLSGASASLGLAGRRQRAEGARKA